MRELRENRRAQTGGVKGKRDRLTTRHTAWLKCQLTGGRGMQPVHIGGAAVDLPGNCIPRYPVRCGLADVALRCTRDADGQDMSGRVVAEEDLLIVLGNRKGDVRAARSTIL